ncbi:hypothetical protein Mapa_002918 [Marchantia paleacea]|nr:hypothetical protein Mapa_002918 [Marchantia paleacea]
MAVSQDAAEPAANPDRTPNVGDVSKQLYGTDNCPRQFIWDENLRPGAQSLELYDSQSGSAIPIIDMARIEAGEVEAVAKEMADASEKWGFFQIINHGVSQKVIDEAHRQFLKLFAEPVEVKERASLGPYAGYDGRHPHLGNTGVPWAEVLTSFHNPQPQIEKIEKAVWPEGNPAFSKAILEYGNATERVAQRILKILPFSLGLDKEFFIKHFADSSRSQSALRAGYYPACPDPSKALGTGPHSDPFCLTVLNQDGVGGLQIKKDDMWLNIKPRHDAFVINIGDVLQAWTNGRFRSVEHRVLVNKTQPRLSLVFFYAPPLDCEISAPEKFIDADNPRLYKSFTWKEYLHCGLFLTSRISGKSALEKFARISDHEMARKSKPRVE